MDFLPILVKLRRVTRFINMENKRIEKQYGVSIPQILCLHWLYNQPDYRASATAIKEHLQLNASTVTGIVQRLEKRGLIARCPNANDLRRNQIILTARGLELIQQSSTGSETLLSRLGQLSLVQIGQLEKSIDMLIDNLDAGADDGEDDQPNPLELGL